MKLVPVNSSTESKWYDSQSFTCIDVSQNHWVHSKKNEHSSRTNLRKGNHSAIAGEYGPSSLMCVHMVLAIVQRILLFDIVFADSIEADNLKYLLKTSTDYYLPCKMQM